MVAVVRGPPQRTLLRGRRADEREARTARRDSTGTCGARSSGGTRPVIANIRMKYVTKNKIDAVRVTPVKIASNGRRWTAKNASDERMLTCRRLPRHGPRSVMRRLRADRSALRAELIGQPRGEQRHQFGLFLVERLEADLLGVELLVDRGDPLDELLGRSRSVSSNSTVSPSSSGDLSWRRSRLAVAFACFERSRSRLFEVVRRVAIVVSSSGGESAGPAGARSQDDRKCCQPIVEEWRCEAEIAHAAVITA